MMKITGLSHLFKWENLHNWWLTKYFFAPLYVFNLELNRENVSEPQTLSGRLFQSLGAKYEKVLPPLVDFAILGPTKRAEFCDLRERVGL